MSDDSQERPLEPSAHKLRKAREKGQVATSPDFVAGATVIVALVFLIFSWPTFVALFSNLLTNSLRGFRSDFNALGLNYFLAAMEATLSSITPLFIIVTVVAVIANIIHKKGIPFSIHPIIPDFKKINPGQGLKKLFGRRNLTEFAISLLRSVIWFALAIGLCWILWPAIVNAPHCGLACVVDAGIEAGMWIVILAMIMLILTGIFDIPVQFALFRHEQKMSHQELKRELRDTQGSPEFKGHRRDTHRDAASSTLGTGNATFMIEGASGIIALRFDAEDAPIPIVTAKGQGPHVDRILRAARKSETPVVQAPQLTAEIYRQVAVGENIRSEHFPAIAAIIIDLGIPIG